MDGKNHPIFIPIAQNYMSKERILFIAEEYGAEISKDELGIGVKVKSRDYIRELWEYVHDPLLDRGQEWCIFPPECRTEEGRIKDGVDPTYYVYYIFCPPNWVEYLTRGEKLKERFHEFCDGCQFLTKTLTENNELTCSQYGMCGRIWERLKEKPSP